MAPGKPFSLREGGIYLQTDGGISSRIIDVLKMQKGKRESENIYIYFKYLYVVYFSLLNNFLLYFMT